MSEKVKVIHYIYKITCKISNKYYLGMHSTTDINDGYMGSGRILKRSIKKYGEENHIKEILGFYESRELLIEAEKSAITLEVLRDKNSMNIMIGGGGGFISEEHYKKMNDGASKFLKNKWKDEEYRKKITENLLRMLIQNHKDGKINYNTFEGKKHKEETLKLMRERKIGHGLGKNNSQYGTCWITKDGINKKIKKEEINNYLNSEWIKGRVNYN